MNKYMKLANDLATSNLLTNDGGPFGAVIVKNNKIIGKGKNQVLKKNDPTAHAEIMAIRNACQNLKTHDLSGCVLYTTCYPCPMCISAIIWSNIKTVYFGNTKKDAADIGFRDDFIYEYLDNQKGNNYLKLEQIDYDKTINAFKQFKDKDDKTIY